jgi:hypothetical protein
MLLGDDFDIIFNIYYAQDLESGNSKRGKPLLTRTYILIKRIEWACI